MLKFFAITGNEQFFGKETSPDPIEITIVGDTIVVTDHETKPEELFRRYSGQEFVGGNFTEENPITVNELHARATRWNLAGE